MGRRINAATAMNRLLTALLVLAASTGCYKDDVDISALHTNPFDPDYTGENVFVFDDTYLESVLLGSPPTPVLVQVVQVHVKEELLPYGASYSVQFTDPDVDDPVVQNPVPGTHTFKYYRIEATAEPGVEKCFELRLFNDQSTGRPETICCTL